jgi:hypothetical protein
LLAFVLRPAAHVLDQLVRYRLTHRGIWVDNVFRVGPGHPVVLGCAWATPPAALQPAAVEPPYVSICPPASRGDDTVADDVYALGMLMLTLALGRPPVAGLEEAKITRQKLDHGSYATLVGEHRLGNFVSTCCAACRPRTPSTGRCHRCCSIQPRRELAGSLPACRPTPGV